MWQAEPPITALPNANLPAIYVAAQANQTAIVQKERVLGVCFKAPRDN